ncbi:MAG: ferredoxin--NADP reductase [Gammaproteobacteria bacterium]|nr:MAG: ferredoxin--NADP reductase [Gammaproteobacteria bacterium]UCH40068.1 MAG: ferredoxin--NADP reductase [Gammaproteobacteria bacterium]
MSNWLNGKVIDNRRLNEYLTSLIIDADLGGYEAGQFVRIGLPDGDDVLARPYSLVNTPQERHLEVYFNVVEEGPLSPRLFDLQAGDDILVASNPSGFLTVSEIPDCKHLWMIATGTGIGPFLAILKSEAAWEKFEKVVLCYSVSYASELAYQQVIEMIQARHGEQFSYVPVVTRESRPGALDKRIPFLMQDGSLEQTTGIDLNASDSHVMMCGSSHMITDVSAELNGRDMKKHRRRDPGHFTTEKYH